MQFPKNAWYGAIWSRDLADKPVARTLLGEPVVLYRSNSGKPAALEDRCCYRAAPLSLGEIEGDNLRCAASTTFALSVNVSCFDARLQQPRQECQSGCKQPCTIVASDARGISASKDPLQRARAFGATHTQPGN